MFGSIQIFKGFRVAALCSVLVLSVAAVGNTAPVRVTPSATPLTPKVPTAVEVPTVQEAVTPDVIKPLNPVSLKILNLSISPIVGGTMPVGSSATFGFIIQNVGIGKVQLGTTYSIACTVLSGPNPCPLASSTGQIPQLLPSQSKSYTFIGTTGAQPGEYRLTVTTSLGSPGRPPHIDFTVPGLAAPAKAPKPSLKLKK